ncbi:TetR/AcrR family transcriptional regulator [Marinobacter sp. CHS3-4]|uniref:TetR/AcrR family transcriptional regulator n=1 Tax=Marinobacter sp. CHS3-4 TaxID=3045174 RepID=UPI0024B589F1|nr:TetR/AcrR family transcriptional regulator [Marinobacter sp. CHS3-4]MDI9244625.1 TetR/AcrR family transcriptional regulator [Marinobacter sp. CHS3-4]
MMTGTTGSDATPTKAHSGKLTRGHKKKARTRQQLIDAALRIYAEKGAGELALNELAREAGVSNGTIYNYFRSKEAVLEAVAIALAENLSQQVNVLSEGVTNGAERLAVGVRVFVRKAEKDPNWASALVNVVRYAEGMRSKLAANVLKDLRAGYEQKLFSFDNEELAIGLVVSGAMGAMIDVVEDRAVEHHGEIVASMLLQALGMDREEAQAIAYRPLPA